MRGSTEDAVVLVGRLDRKPVVRLRGHATEGVVGVATAASVSVDGVPKQPAREDVGVRNEGGLAVLFQFSSFYDAAG